MGTLALLGGIVAYAATAGDRLPEVVSGIGAAGWTLAAVALVGRWPTLLAWGLAAVGAAYAVLLGLRTGGVDPRAPFIGAALFGAAELGLWSVEVLEGESERAIVVRRVLLVAAGALGTALVGGLLLLLAAGVRGGVALEFAGVLAAVLTLASVAFLAARSRESTST